MDKRNTARYTAERLAEAVSAQYHPNNKLIKAGGPKKKNLMLREHPTFSGRPWIASELGTIAHLVGSDAQPPQLQKAPAQPLPAMPECRIGDEVESPVYLKGSDPTLTLDKELELPMLTLDKDLELPMLTLDKDLELPMLTLDKDLELPMLTLD